MEKKILRILSFLMVAMLAFTLMGLSLSAEEFDIPVIEEVSEEELDEAIPEEEVEENRVAIYGAGDVAVVGENAYATLDEALAASSDGAEIIIVGEASITDKAVSNRRFLVKEGGKLTIKGGSIKDYASGSAIEAESGAEVTLDGVEITENYSGSLRRGAVFMAAGSKLYVDGATNVTMNRQAALFNAAGELNTGIVGSYDNIRLIGSDILTVKEGFTGAIGLWNGTVDNTGKVTVGYDFNVGLAEEGYANGGTISHDSYGGTMTVSDGVLSWEAECKIGSTSYPFLEGAIASLSSSSEATIELLKDININEHDGAITISNKGKLVIDGGSNKYTINCVGKDRTTSGSIYAGNVKQHITGSILVGGTELTIRNINITRAYNRAYGFFKSSGAKPTIIVSDNTFIGGTASKKLSGSNGSVAFLDVNGSEFILDGVNAKIEYVQDSNYGAIAAFTANTKVTIKNGTIANVTSSYGCIGFRSGTSFEMTGGVLESANSGRAVYFVTGTTSANITGGTIGGVLAKGNATITASNATLGNITLNDSSKLIATGITAGNLTATTASADAVPEVTLNGAAVGVVTLDDASKGTVPKLKLSGKINATSISMTIADAILLTGNVETDKIIPVNVVEKSIRFGSTSDISYTGAECFYDADITYMNIPGRRYVPGTSYANKETEDILTTRNAGLEKALIFDYGFTRVANGETDIFKGTGFGTGNPYKSGAKGSWLHSQTTNGYITYMLKDISCINYVYKDTSQVTIDGKATTVYSHVNMASASLNYVIDGNGFTMIGDWGGDPGNLGNYHVFRIYSQTNATFRNLTFDGDNVKKFINAENAGSGGGNITLENCIIRNTKNSAVSMNTGSLTLNNVKVENCSGSGIINVGTTKVAAIPTVFNMTGGSITGCTLSNYAALYLATGTTANLSGDINISNNKKSGKNANFIITDANSVKVVGPLSGSIGISNTKALNIGEILEGGSIAEGAIVPDYQYTIGSYSINYGTEGGGWVSYTDYSTYDVIVDENDKIYTVAECYIGDAGIGSTMSFTSAISSVPEGGEIHLVQDIDVAKSRNDQVGWNLATKKTFTINGHGHKISVGETREYTNEKTEVTLSKQAGITVQLFGTNVEFKDVIIDGNGTSGSNIFSINGGAQVKFTNGTVIKNYTNTTASSGFIHVFTQSHDSNTDKTKVYAGKVVLDNAKVENLTANNGSFVLIYTARYLETPEVQLEINNSSFTGGNYSSIINMDTKTQAIINGSNFKNISGRLASTAGNSLTITDTDIENIGIEGKNVNGGVLSMSNCTVTLKNVNIKNCKAVHTGTDGSTAGGFVFVNSGTINADNLVIDGCVSGTQGSAMYIANGTVNLDNTEIKNCNVASMSETYGGALKVMGEAKLLVGGKTIITNNTQGAEGSAVTSNIDITSGGTLIIADDFTGNIKVKGEAEKIVAEENFTTLESVESIVREGINGATFAYYDAATGKFGWANIPTLNVVTDAGTYSKGTEKPGVVRFKTTFATVTDGSIASYGIYALGSNSFSGTMNEGIKGFGKINVDDAKKAPAAGKSFYADVVNIPAANYDSPIYATHFIYFKGIDNPWFNTLDAVTLNGAGQDGVVKDLGTYAA